MTILSTSKERKEAVISFGIDELIVLCNTLYRETKGDNARAIHYLLSSNLMIARDLTQYGHIDGFCLDSIVKCRKRAEEKV